MPRPRFTPDDQQARVLRELELLAARQAADDARLTDLIVRAKAQDVPIEHIAKAGSVTTKTVYRRLGHPMK